jgi:hypothetical protein
MLMIVTDGNNGVHSCIQTTIVERIETVDSPLTLKEGYISGRTRSRSVLAALCRPPRTIPRLDLSSPSWIEAAVSAVRGVESRGFLRERPILETINECCASGSQQPYLHGGIDCEADAVSIVGIFEDEGCFKPHGRRSC